MLALALALAYMASFSADSIAAASSMKKTATETATRIKKKHKKSQTRQCYLGSIKADTRIWLCCPRSRLAWLLRSPSRGLDCLILICGLGRIQPGNMDFNGISFIIISPFKRLLSVTGEGVREKRDKGEGMRGRG